MQQNPHQSRELSQILRGLLNHPAVKTAIVTSIVALSVGLGFVNCLNNNTEKDDCFRDGAPLAIGFGFVGAVVSRVISNCIRECNQRPNSRVVPLGPPGGLVTNQNGHNLGP